ncbi:MAG: hypothetical protein R2772_02045 [Chitinophagales bacterium]
METLKSKIESLLLPKLEEMNLFLVEVVIGANYKIQVFADGNPSITIQQCAKLSRFLEAHLDEDASVPENYNLEVSSPGMSNPLRVPQQFEKRIGSTLKITLNNGELVYLILQALQEGSLFGLKTKPLPKTKKPVKAEDSSNLESIEIPLTEIKQALLHFNF